MTDDHDDLADALRRALDKDRHPLADTLRRAFGTDNPTPSTTTTGEQSLAHQDHALADRLGATVHTDHNH